MGKFRVNSRFTRFMNGKGFYIALAICLVAVGSAAYIAASSSYGPFNGSSGTSSNTAASGTGGGTVAWGTESQTTRANKPVSDVPKEPASSSQAASSQATSSSQPAPASSKTGKTSEMTNDRGEKLVFMLPVNGEIISAYSNNAPAYDKTMDDWRVHNWVGISAGLNTPVAADADGTVTDVRNDPLTGYTVVIDHGNGVVSSFSNLTKDVTVRKSQKVEAGDTIGCIGSSAAAECALAPHLHYAMTKNGTDINPLSFIPKN